MRGSMVLCLGLGLSFELMAAQAQIPDRLRGDYRVVSAELYENQTYFPPEALKNAPRFMDENRNLRIHLEAVDDARWRCRVGKDGDADYQEGDLERLDFPDLAKIMPGFLDSPEAQCGSGLIMICRGTPGEPIHYVDTGKRMGRVPDSGYFLLVVTGEIVELEKITD